MTSPGPFRSRSDRRAPQPRHLLPLLSVGVAAWLATSPAPAQMRSLTPEQWREDLGVLVERIEAVHPDPTRRISREDFLQLAARLDEDLPALDTRQAASRMIALVASLRDGHSYLRPHDLGFLHFLPIRFYKFSDGLFVTCSMVQPEDLVGARVLEIGTVTAHEALDRIGDTTSSDNELGRIGGACHLSSVDILAGLGIVESVDEVRLVVETRDGLRLELTIPSLVPQKGDAYGYLRSRRETEWPPPGAGTTAFEGLHDAEDFYWETPEQNADLPLHARGHSAYWYQHLPERDAVFMQINTVTGKKSGATESFETTWRRMFRLIDEEQVTTFVLDLRFNRGGNGDILLPFVHEVIKRDDSINRSGHFFVLVGRRTFSAAVLLAGQLHNHTQAILVGEPPGAPLNFFGDNTSITLPNSGMQLWVSARYWQLSRWEDRSYILPVEIPAEFTSAAYFSGTDPALDAIFSGEDLRSIAEIARHESPELAQTVYQARKARYGHVQHWQPFGELEMNILGYDLLAARRAGPARVVFAMAAERYPESPNAWDSLGEAQFVLEQYEDSLASYQRALALDPENRSAHGQREMIAEIEALLEKAGR